VLLTFLFFTYLAFYDLIKKRKKKKDITMLTKADKPPKPDSIRPTLLDDQSEEVKAMVKRGDKEAVNLFCSRVLDGNDNEQMVALWALGQIGDPKAIPTVRQALNDPNEYVRKRAREILSKLGNMEESYSLNEEQMKKAQPYDILADEPIKEKSEDSIQDKKYCTECGFENLVEVKSCKSCGTQLKSKK